VNRLKGEVLNVSGASTANGANVDQQMTQVVSMP
jgi:hypothetical protein